MHTPHEDGTSDDASERLPPGARVGRWIVGEVLGHGATATVYAAVHADLGREAALKVLHEGARFSASARLRFLREGRAAAALSHRNAVAVLDVAIYDGMPCLVMERVDGETLAALLAREGTLPVPRAVAIILPLCAALAAAHRAGVVHRDIKPSNVAIVGDAGAGEVRPVLLDFGAARLLVEGDDELTRSRALLGTPAYMAPEQASAARAATPACDQFSLAATLLEMVSGRRPYRGDRWTECFAAAVRGEVLDVDEVAPTLPRPFAAALRRALSPDTAHRFASMEAFAGALRGSLLASDVRPSRGPFGSVRRVALVAFAVVTAALGVAVASRTRPTPATVATRGPATQAVTTAAVPRAVLAAVASARDVWRANDGRPLAGDGDRAPGGDDHAVGDQVDASAQRHRPQHHGRAFALRRPPGRGAAGERPEAGEQHRTPYLHRPRR